MGPGSVLFNGDELLSSFQDLGEEGIGYIGWEGSDIDAFAPPVPLPGIGGTPWSFVFESETALWVADSSAVSIAHVYPYTFSGTEWVKGPGVRFGTDPNPCVSVTGTFDGADWILVGVTNVRSGGIYNVYRYNATSGAQAVLFRSSPSATPSPSPAR